MVCELDQDDPKGEGNTIANQIPRSTPQHTHNQLASADQQSYPISTINRLKWSHLYKQQVFGAGQNSPRETPFETEGSSLVATRDRDPMGFRGREGTHSEAKQIFLRHREQTVLIVG